MKVFACLLIGLVALLVVAPPADAGVRYLTVVDQWGNTRVVAVDDGQPDSVLLLRNSRRSSSTIVLQQQRHCHDARRQEVLFINNGRRNAVPEVNNGRRRGGGQSITEVGGAQPRVIRTRSGPFVDRTVIRR